MLAKKYDEHSIEVKKGLEGVRARPGMYIGDSGIDGLHHLIWEIVDNSVDEHMEGHCNNINIKINNDGSLTVIDDGRGIPVGIHPKEGISSATVVFTVLHAGGKFDSSSYKTSGGLHGVGASVTNALSEWLEVEIKKEGKIYSQRFERGIPIDVLKEIGTYEGNKTGTKVTFKPDDLIFKETIVFEDERVYNRLRELSYLNKGLKLTFESEISGRKETYLAKNGLMDYMNEICTNKMYEPIEINRKYELDEKTMIDIDLILVHGSDFKGKTLSFANNIRTIEDGTHVIGTINGLTKSFMDKKDIFKIKDSDTLKGENFKDGLYSIITVKLSNPEFRGQVKGKLNNPEARTGTYNAVKEFMDDWIDHNEKVVKEIIKKAISAKKALDAMNRAYDLIERKSSLGDGFLLPGKLTDCQSKNPQECEILIVEGDSAGGCFSGETKIKTSDNKYKTILEMKNDFDNGIDNFIYTYNKTSNKIEIQKVLNCWETKITNDLVYVTLDNNEKVLCTSDHKFMLKNGDYKEANQLNEGDSLMPMYTFISTGKEKGLSHKVKGYEYVVNPNDTKSFLHVLADEYNLKNNLYKTLEEKNDYLVRHHIDFNKYNNNPTNIEKMYSKDHIKFHMECYEKTLGTPESKAKSKEMLQTEFVRNKIKKSMARPESKKLRSEIVSNLWKNNDYRNKFKENHHKLMRQKQIEDGINLGFKDYWAKEENKKAQSERVKEYYQVNIHKKEQLSILAKKQWENKDLLEWRKQKTKEQMSNKENIEKKLISESLKRISNSLDVLNKVGIDVYETIRKENPKKIYKIKTLIEKIKKFKNNEIINEKTLLESNLYIYNHKVLKVEKYIGEAIPVYDIEVPETHNFALGVGVFVHNSCKSARDRKTQAVLPLKGKPLNTHKNNLMKILQNEEIQSLIKALGCGYKENFDITKLRYHKIIILTDADVDGSHIKTLLLGYFYNFTPELIEKGHVYIGQPPLYYVNYKKNKIYLLNDEELENFKKKHGNVTIQRFKGLGEMNPEQLEETTLNVKSRILKQVTMDDREQVLEVMDMLLGDNLEARKEFITTNSKKADIDL